MEPLNTRRLGRFQATREIVESDGFRLVVMPSLSVVRCEFQYALDTFYYHAISPLFDEVTGGDLVPEYVWLIHETEPLGQITARVQKATDQRFWRISQPW